MRILIMVLLGAMLFPASVGLSQVSDTAPSLTIMLDSNPPYVYRDSDGYTVVVGQVENNDAITAVTNIQIRANFYDDTGVEPLESSSGSTVIDVIPSLGSSPYVIKSKSPNSEITQVTVHLDGFEPSPSKLQQMTNQIGNLLYSNEVLYFSGTTYSADAPSSNAAVHVAFYDGFIPPRILQVFSINLGDIPADEQVNFDFEEIIPRQAVEFYIFSESDTFDSDMISLKIPESSTLTKLVTISNVSLRDDGGNSIQEARVGLEASIQSESWIRFSADQPTNETEYTYYVQVKSLGEKPYVEFLGKYDGVYTTAGTASQSVTWIPENPGAYFIETFVWDRNNIPISDPGPFALVSVK